MIDVKIGQLQLDAAAVRQLATGSSGPVVQAVSRAGTAVVGYARVDLISKRIGATGKLGQQIDSRVTVDGDRVVSRVVSGAPYSIFVHEGTASPIRPRIARSLRFRGSGGTFVFAAQVRGTRETGRFTPFLRNGLERLRLNDFT